MTCLTMNLTLAPDAAIDLHMHTTYSDGRWPAQQLIDYLASEHFDLVAVTDHDRVDKVAEIQALAAEKHLPVLSGVEMSTTWNGKMGDLLCYGFDPENNGLMSIVEKFAQIRQEIMYEIYENLLRKGYTFPNQMEILAKNDGKLLHPLDNGLLLREHGYAPDWSTAVKMIREAGYHSTRVDMAETVEVVHQSGGVCLIAHPGRRESGFTFYDPTLLDQLRTDVPIDGIEVYHPSHSQESIEIYLEYVRKHNLLGSTGSDSHCIPTRMPIKYRAEISRNLLEQVGIKVA
ncbi:MAG TPA: PHP domain-containing protein [Ktedonobacteraceae bacterium]